jgi:hypothetical protein
VEQVPYLWWWLPETCRLASVKKKK